MSLEQIVRIITITVSLSISVFSTEELIEDTKEINSNQFKCSSRTYDAKVRWESHLGHIGGIGVLSPLCHPCSFSGCHYYGCSHHSLLRIFHHNHKHHCVHSHFKIQSCLPEKMHFLKKALPSFLH